MVFIPRKYRHYKAVLYLMIAECPIVLPVLILTGIAAHDTYTTKLWQDGANNGPRVVLRHVQACMNIHDHVR